jgi:hypothetical protein
MMQGGMMELDDTRTEYEQVVAMLSGASRMIPELRHLRALHEAMQESHQVCLIQIANDLEALKRATLERP